MACPCTGYGLDGCDLKCVKRLSLVLGAMKTYVARIQESTILSKHEACSIAQEFLIADGDLILNHDSQWYEENYT